MMRDPDVYSLGCSVLSCCCMPSSLSIAQELFRVENAANCKQLQLQSSCTWPCSGRPPRYWSQEPYDTVAPCAVRAPSVSPHCLLICPSSCIMNLWSSCRDVGRYKPGEPRWTQSKIFRDRHAHRRWAEFDGGKRGAGQGKEGCLSARKTAVCTAIDVTYVDLDSHVWHAVFRGCIESFLSGFVLGTLLPVLNFSRDTVD